MTRGIVLDDVEAASARLFGGTIEDDTLGLLLPLDAIELPAAELLLSETGTATVDGFVMELGRILDDARLTDEAATSCEEGITDPTVDRGTVFDVILLKVSPVLEATAD